MSFAPISESPKSTARATACSCSTSRKAAPPTVPASIAVRCGSSRSAPESSADQSTTNPPISSSPSNTYGSTPSRSFSPKSKNTARRHRSHHRHPRRQPDGHQSHPRPILTEGQRQPQVDVRKEHRRLGARQRDLHRAAATPGTIGSHNGSRSRRPESGDLFLVRPGRRQSLPCLPAAKVLVRNHNTIMNPTLNFHSVIVGHDVTGIKSAPLRRRPTGHSNPAQAPGLDHMIAISKIDRF